MIPFRYLLFIAVLTCAGATSGLVAALVLAGMAVICILLVEWAEARADRYTGRRR